MTKVSIIIPYYQREEGILRRALASVLAQQVASDVRVEVIVVDDGSPIPPQGEIEGLVFVPPFHLNLITQPNGGVAAARNTGLRAVSEDTTYISFLDSDDIWDPQHLPTALAALEQGYDFYFCDNKRVGHHESNFKSAADYFAFIAENGRLIREGLYEIEKKAFVDYFLRKFVTQISTVVCCRKNTLDVTFSPLLRMAGEDRLFLLQVIGHSQRLCCNTQGLVVCGEGVNICNGRYDWSDSGHLIRYAAEIRALYEFKKNLKLSPDNQNYLLAETKSIQRDFAFLTVRYFLKYREKWPQELRTMVRQDPTFWRWYPMCVLYVMVLYPLRLYKPQSE